jgi:RimJ/RimL family protein N-acetyltransferase
MKLILPRHDLSVVSGDRNAAVPSADWRKSLPELCGRHVVLRELRTSDAAALHALLTPEDVARFISLPPTTVEGFERFITWTQIQREAGNYVCFAITVSGSDPAVGLIQVRQLESGFSTAEWGFALGQSFWGRGVFHESAELALAFCFDVLHVHRMEARAALVNGRGIGALMKLGAVRECVLRGSFLCGGQPVDQALYAIVASDWRASRRRGSPTVPLTSRRH